MEALIRWDHPEKGLLAAGAFLPLIDDPALAVSLGEWVRKTALEQYRCWQGQGFDFDLAVNVDAADLLSEGFPKRLQRLLESHPDFPAQHLVLEVVETSVLEDLGQATSVAKSCKALGVDLALDDFGTGFSSLSHLKHLPVQQLKIDRSFVLDMMADADDLAIVEAVINLGRGFRLDVLAEGVETGEHIEALLQLRCRHVQGYFIARPMPAQEVARWVEHWRPPEEWRGIEPLSESERALLFAEADLRQRFQQLSDLVHSRATPPSMGGAADSGGQFSLWLKRFSGGALGPGSNVEISKLCNHEQTLTKLCSAGKYEAAEVSLAKLSELIGALLDRLRSLRQQAGLMGATK